jgi:hypothetical protein
VRHRLALLVVPVMIARSAGLLAFQQCDGPKPGQQRGIVVVA